MKTIHVAPSVEDKTPELLKKLPLGHYRLTRLRRVEKPIWKDSGQYPLVISETGALKIVDRQGGPVLMLGQWPYEGWLTSWITGAAIVDDGSLEVTTENSVYRLEGPLGSEEGNAT